MKAKIIVAALAMAFAAQANAAIVSNQTNFSSDQLFLSVFDATAQTSYTRGLGLTMADLFNQAGISFGSPTTGSGFTAVGGSINYSIAADSLLSSYLSTAATAGDSLSWSVIGGGAPVVKYGTSGYATTSTSIDPFSSTKITQMNGVNAGYINEVNKLMPSAVGNTDSITAALGTAAYVLNPGNGMGTNFGTFSPFSTDAVLGDSMSFYLVSPTSGSRGYNGLTNVYQFNDVVTLSSTGTLSISPVPEAGEGAMLAFGMALMGFVVNRRNKKQA